MIATKAHVHRAIDNAGERAWPSCRERTGGHSAVLGEVCAAKAPRAGVRGAGTRVPVRVLAHGGRLLSRSSNPSRLAGVLLAAGLIVVAPVCAQNRPPAPVSSIASAGDLPARVERLERTLSGRGLLEMLNRIDQLQREVQNLRGQLEEATNRQDDLLKRQRDLYLDLDRRISALERGGGRTAAPLATPGSGGEPAPTDGREVDRPASPGADSGAENHRYQAAFELLREGNYDAAKEQFRSFLADYPNGSLAANAQYWLGEASYVTRDFDTARADFGKVVADFPDSPKVADALLKLGYLNYETQNWSEARAILSKLAQGYPDSSAARLASQRLERMDKEGR